MKWAMLVPRLGWPGCLDSARVAHCHVFHFDKQAGQRFESVLEDLDALGVDARYDTDNDRHLLSCINWIAAFHAGFQFIKILFWVGLKGFGKSTVLLAFRYTPTKNGWGWKKRELKSSAALVSVPRWEARLIKTLFHGDAVRFSELFVFLHKKKKSAAVRFSIRWKVVLAYRIWLYLISSALTGKSVVRKPAYYWIIILAGYGEQLTAQANLRLLLPKRWSRVAKTLFVIAWAGLHRLHYGWSPNLCQRDTPFQPRPNRA